MTESLLLIASLCIAQPPTGPPHELTVNVRRLVRQLDNNDPTVRQDAEDGLIGLGPSVLPLLPRSTERMPPETRERLGRIRQTLQLTLATQVTQASRVTLQGTMTPIQALNAVQKQTGNRIMAPELAGDGSAMDCDFEKTPFWEAIDKILDHANLTINPYGGRPQTLSVESRRTNQLPRFGRAAYEGPFRFEPTLISAVRDLRNSETGSNLRIRVESAWEPRLNPIALSLPLNRILAVDDQRRVMIIKHSNASLKALVQPNACNIEFDIPFEILDRSSQRILSLQGVITAVIPGRIETFRFGNLDKIDRSSQHLAGATVTLDEVRKNDDVYEVRLRLRLDNDSGVFASHQGWFYRNDAFVLDSKGERIEQAGLQLTGRKENEVGIAYLFAFDKPISEYTFVYKTPSLILKKEISFELKDIPLP